uniref:Leucine-rich repeat-containing N-terminal plant-type domain-containing protein n=1 Tax=Physcomitrium patens TaxID=3218 RepID=A0A7I4FJ58_PHYPA
MGLKLGVGKYSLVHQYCFVAPLIVLLDHRNCRGMQCLNFINCTSNATHQDCDAHIIGVTLQSASLVGSIPPTIGNISTLYTMELTENPNLTGTLPRTLNETSLSIL